MPILSDIEFDRIKAKLREALGRDLTPEEYRYLGLSSSIVSKQQEPEKAKSAAKRRKA